MDMDAALALSARGMRGNARSSGGTSPRGKPNRPAAMGIAADPADPADAGAAQRHRSANQIVLCTTRSILTRAALILTKT